MKNNLLGFVFFILAFSSTLFSYDEYMDGVYAYKEKDYKKSFTYFQQAANKGNGEAYFYIGVQYQFGYGVQQNIDEAIISYKKGAELNDYLSMASLGILYKDTETLRDYKKAAYWYEKSIQSDKYDVNSRIALGLIYYDGGYGVTQNKIKSYKYWKECASLDESKVLVVSLISSCQNNLDILCKESPWACQK